MAEHIIEVADYDPRRGVVVLTEEGGVVTVEAGNFGVEIHGTPAGLRDLARWCLALADEHAQPWSHRLLGQVPGLVHVRRRGPRP